MEVIIKKPIGLNSLADLSLDPKALQRVTLGVVKAVKESFGDAESMSKSEAEKRVEMAVRFILRCVGDGGMSVTRALTFLPTALPVELAGLEFPVPTGDVFKVPEPRRTSR
ncbi:MAG: hypothetical protein PHX83_06965 [Acidobacteriia bacterium]|nr:hypothetical protein [Terriglobia bacterium]